MIGFLEIGLIIVLSLIVLGPRRMFVAARYGGLAWRKLRILYGQIVDEVDQQLRLDEMERDGRRKQKKRGKDG